MIIHMRAVCDYGFIISACSCSSEGSISAICDRESGKCNCLSNIVGMNCSECAENYWDLSSGDGCKECSCNITGMLRISYRVYTCTCNL